MEIINHYISEPFATGADMDNVLALAKVAKAAERKGRLDTILDAPIVTTSCPERETVSRKNSEIISSLSSEAPERPFKPRKKREIF